ncbi:MAG: HEAT repeat domain-containing protein [Promethearchaeota archaeon]
MELSKDSAIIRGILHVFMEGDLEEQREATHELKEMSHYAIDPLIQIIRDEKERKPIRLEAARAIVVLGSDSVEPLIELLQEDEIITRMAAIRSLGAISDAKAVPKLLDNIHTEEKKIRLAAIWALGQIKDKQAIPPLLSLLNESDWGIHIEAIEALIKIGDDTAILKSINPLIHAMYNEETNIRRIAVTLLEKIKEKVNIAIFADIFNMQKDPILRKRLIESIGELRDPRTISLFVSVIEKEENATLRAIALESLQKVDTEEAYKWAIRGLSDKDLDVRYSAVDVLKKIKDKQAVEPLIATLNDEKIIKATIEALGEIGDPKAVDSLIPILESPNPLLRASVVIALGQIDTDSKKTVKPLIKAMNDTDEEVQCLSRHILEDKAKKMGYASKDDLIKDINS